MKGGGELVVVALVIAGCEGAGLEAVDVPRFTDVTHEAFGVIEATPLPPSLAIRCGPVSLIPAGAAVADYDDDGDLDVFLARVDLPNVLLANDGRGRFTDVAPAVGLDVVAGSNGALFFDADGDGDLDLWVASIGPEPDMLFVQGPDGRFGDEAALRGATVPPPERGCRAHMSPSAGDPDHDGDLDVYVTRWDPDIGTRSLPVYFVNDGRGHFVESAAAAGVQTAALAFSTAFADVDGDGWEDLLVASDFGTSRLFRNRGSSSGAPGTFEPVTDAAGVGTDENGMGSAVADLDADGDLDWLVTSIHGTEDGACSGWGCSGNRLYLNDGRGSFADDTDAWGVRAGGWGWGAAAFDANLDGRLDLVSVNGYRVPGSETSPLFAPYATGRLHLWLAGTDGGGPAMREVAEEAGAAIAGNGRVVIPFDADRDGDEDLLVTHAGEPVRLLRNDTPPASWLGVRIRGAGRNTHGIGARVELESERGTQHALVHANSGFLATPAPEAHFGLAGATGPVTVRVHFPTTGQTVVRRDVAPNQVLEVHER